MPFIFVAVFIVVVIGAIFNAIAQQQTARRAF